MNQPISDYHLQIGEVIKQYRIDHSLSDADFARRIGIKVETLRRIERGEVNFRLTTLIKLMEVMGKVSFQSK